MLKRFAATSFVLAALVGLSAPAHADIIFDNTTASSANNGITTTSNPQFANSVTAASGTPRAVTQLLIGFTSQGVPATASLQAFLYANDGANGAPGTLLWSSAVMANVAINSFNQLVSFAVPSIVVPNSFSFAASITNASVAVGFVPVAGASVGTYNGAYTGSPGNFSSVPSSFEIEGRVIAGAAVPEPSSLALAAVGLASATLARRLRGRRDARG